jgi:hypothetical protein
MYSEQDSPIRTIDTLEPAWAETLAELRRRLGVDFSVAGGSSGELLHRGTDGPGHLQSWQEDLVRLVAQRGQVEFLGEEVPIALLAIPFEDRAGSTWVAIGAFLVRDPAVHHDLSPAGELLGRSPAELSDWVRDRHVWPGDSLQRLGETATEKLRADREIERLRREVESVSDNLSSTYEEISLLHSLTRNLRLTASDAELGRLALEWLMETMPVQSVALFYLPTGEDDGVIEGRRGESRLLTAGDCPVGKADFERLLEATRPSVGSGPLVLNPPVTDGASWQFPAVRSLSIVPLAESENVFGWLAAFNHVDGGELGTIEANLLNSVGAILGIHAGNIELYRQQEELLTGVVRALTSAIDAKDQYTCGHSDRVARVAVRLGREMGLEGNQLKTIYMAGLLHDVGKIGIDDTVLRKPGRLTEAEYEHIKQHPELGYKIIKDVKRLADIFPPVLHHHEQWDGGGYPHELAGESIPLFARIIAVADAYDAMASDRPYRRGMDEKRVDEIFRQGSGQQWDAKVIEAFFAIREDVRAISSTTREHPRLDLPDHLPVPEPAVSGPTAIAAATP